ncbi:hypothetical protein IFM12275_59310 [Nocardia sputorum]|uniref:DUF2637 domain-containing protein n=1 Tax=Nocardia sputorum TaxID=2984338 RepID=UPI002493BC04|nr:DUF2637 domain-containing protein [Nocardia sputorum]BDT95955.1 hypothetical protein IFM12275_59310 [Nocardia sputorum]
MMTGFDSGADAVRRSDSAAHRSAPDSAQGGVRTPEEASAVRFFWGELLLVAAMSIAGNIVHAWINAPEDKRWIAAFVACFPPVALLAATHGVGLLVRAQNKARFAYWVVVLLTASIAGIAFALSFDALRELAIQVGMSKSLAGLFPVIIDGAIGQATIALLVLARTDRTGNEPAVRTEQAPVHRPEPVRTVSVREVHTETRSTSTELTEQQARPELRTAEQTAIEVFADHAPGPAAKVDRWTRVAELLCSADPSGRRDPEKVTEILRLRHEQNWSHARIAEHVSLSSSSVTRTLTAAQEYIQEGAHQ